MEERFATKKEAEQALVEVLRSLDQGSFVARSTMTAGEYLTDWLDGLQLKPSSIYAYRNQLRRHVIPLIGHVRIQQLDPPMVRALRRLQTDENAAGRALSGTSVQLIHQILHRALGDAAREGLVARNVAALVKSPRRTTAERETWSAEQVRRFLEVAQPQYDYAMWLLMPTTGMRRGEICGLQWKDFDPERESLVIRRSLSVISGETILGTPKTTRGRRALSLDPSTVEALRVQRARHAARRLAAGPDFEDGDFVFPVPRGGRLQPSALG